LSLTYPLSGCISSGLSPKVDMSFGVNSLCNLLRLV
jgi:hypothetical protein